ncbi:MAG: VCBS repeat-containing protein [Oscillospiraceae bacterium]|nr:VCBS repeat-containing protein [Oscillospiraceae bacterium]
MLLKKLFLSSLIAVMVFPVTAMEPQDQERSDYERYRDRMEAVQTVEELASNGFVILEDNIYTKGEFANFGKVDIVPALDPKHERIVFFFADEDGGIVYKTDELECNSQRRGELNQPNLDVAGFGLRDINGNGLTDIVIISRSICRSGPYAGVIYTVGDILFQHETGFYRDWRLSDRINRFGMNTDVNTVIAFARDGISTEFLYLADTLDELIENGFQVMHSNVVTFETFGEVSLIYGTFRLAGYYTLMIYLADGEGNLLWNFQPMGRYTNFSSMRSYELADIDGDGKTDLVFHIWYDTLTPEWETERVTDTVIYYQRNGYFSPDWEARFFIEENDTALGFAEKEAVFLR